VLGGRSSAHRRPATGACACASFAGPLRVRPRPARGRKRRDRGRRRRAGCTGKRRRTDFLPLSAFDERALLSDYRFLEEAPAAGDAAQRAAPDRRRAAPPPHLQELAHQVCAPARSARRAARAPGRSCANRRRRLASDVSTSARRGWSSLCCPRTGRLCRRRILRTCPGALCHSSVAASGGPALAQRRAPRGSRAASSGRSRLRPRADSPARRAQARARGVALHLQHPGMERRARNSSCFNRRERRLRWHVEWRFPAAGVTAVDKCAPGRARRRRSCGVRRRGGTRTAWLALGMRGPQPWARFPDLCLAWTARRPVCIGSMRLAR